MIDLHYAATPNGWKISIMLEEIGLPYQVVPVRLDEGDQYRDEFRAISPNGLIPAIVDNGAVGGPLAIFESGAILIYLAEKAGMLLPASMHDRFSVLQWLMWQMSCLGPMAGQNGHFLLYAPEQIPYAINRYGTEVRRLYGVLDRQLGTTGSHIAGDYSIADIACFPWIMTHKKQGLTLDDYPHVKRWFATLRARDPVQRGLAVGGKMVQAQTMTEEAKARFFGYERKSQDAD